MSDENLIKVSVQWRDARSKYWVNGRITSVTADLEKAASASADLVRIANNGLVIHPLMPFVLEWADARSDWVVGGRNDRVISEDFDIHRFRKATDSLISAIEELVA